jgi:hypothetical protein
MSCTGCSNPHPKIASQALERARARYIDSRAENGLTALHIAAAAGSLGCARSLLAAGASLMVRTVDLDMPSLLACPPGSTPLHLAAARGHIALLQAMLQARCSGAWLWVLRSGLWCTAGGARVSFPHAQSGLEGLRCASTLKRACRWHPAAATCGCILRLQGSATRWCRSCCRCEWSLVWYYG